MKNTDTEIKKKTRVNLRQCTREALESLPSGIRVAGDLVIWGRKKLESMPSDLVVGGFLYLWGCESLPSGLVVGWDLNLYGCRNIKDLPSDLQVAGTIYYDSGTGFARDPEKLQELQVRFPGQLKKW